MRTKAVGLTIDEEKAVKIATFTILILGLGLIGGGMFIVVPVFFPRLEPKGIPGGVTILSSMQYPDVMDRFLFEIYDISIDNSSAKSQLFIDLILAETPQDNDTLTVVIPYQVQDCKSLFYEIQEQPSVIYNQSLDCSYISQPLRQQMGKNIQMTLQFTWRFFLTSTSFDTFSLVVPIGFSDMRIVQGNMPCSIIDPPQFSETRVSISDPVGCRPILYNPAPSKVHTFNSRLWNSWIVEVGQDAVGPSLASVRVEYVVERLADEKELKIFVAGALIGSGASVLVESVLHFLRERTSEGKKKVKKVHKRWRVVHSSWAWATKRRGQRKAKL